MSTDAEVHQMIGMIANQVDEQGKRIDKMAELLQELVKVEQLMINVSERQNSQSVAIKENDHRLDKLEQLVPVHAEYINLFRRALYVGVTVITTSGLGAIAYFVVSKQ